MSQDEQKSQAVEETRFVDPNSGAANQPGGVVAGPVEQPRPDKPAKPKDEPAPKEEQQQSEPKGKARKS